MLNEVKSKAGLGWDEFVIDGMSGHYKLDKATLMLPKKDAPAKEPKHQQQPTKKKGNKKKGTEHTAEKAKA